MSSLKWIVPFGIGIDLLLSILVSGDDYCTNMDEWSQVFQNSQTIARWIFMCCLCRYMMYVQ